VGSPSFGQKPFARQTFDKAFLISHYFKIRPVDLLSIGQISVGQMPFSQKPVHQFSVGQMPV